jgi:hypothetical protein
LLQDAKKYFSPPQFTEFDISFHFTNTFYQVSITINTIIVLVAYLLV